MHSKLLLTAILLAIAPEVAAQAPSSPYQRLRTGADSWNARGGFQQAGRGGPGGWGGGFYNPFFTPPIVAGSWYERPYPSHFDYYRQRWGGDPNGNGAYGNPGVEMIPAADCPCLDAVPGLAPTTSEAVPANDVPAGDVDGA